MINGRFQRLNFICFILAAVFATVTVVAVSQMAAEVVNVAHADNGAGAVKNAGQRGSWR